MCRHPLLFSKSKATINASSPIQLFKLRLHPTIDFDGLELDGGLFQLMDENPFHVFEVLDGYLAPLAVLEEVVEIALFQRQVAVGHHQVVL